MMLAADPEAAVRGQWTEVRDALDRRKAAKAMPAANEDVAEVDMFGAAGVAAE